MNSLNTNWIETPVWTNEDKETTRIVFFRKKICFDTLPERFDVRITACSRYKLYINGSFVQYGPAKGDKAVWFADSFELSSCFKTGENCIAVSVFCPPENTNVGNHSTFRFGRARLFVEGFGAENWKCHVDRATEIIRENLTQRLTVQRKCVS